MVKWYYYNKSGEKIGPISVSALKELARQGHLTKDTKIENQMGRSMPAGSVNGLTFPEPELSLEIPDPPKPAPPKPAPPPPQPVSNPVPVEPPPAKPTGPVIELMLSGAIQTVTTQELFNLAALGVIDPQTPVRVNGTMTVAGQANGIQFGQPQIPTISIPEISTPATTGYEPTLHPSSYAPQQNTSGYSSGTRSYYDYENIAAIQRLSTVSILIWCIVSWAMRVFTKTGNESWAMMFFPVVLAAITFSLYCVFNLSKSIRCGTAATVSYVLCIFPGLLIGIPGLIPLFCVYFPAVKILKQAGYTVGMIGADMRQFGHRPIVPEWIKTTLCIMTIIGMFALPIAMLPKIIPAIQKHREAQRAAWNSQTTEPKQAASSSQPPEPKQAASTPQPPAPMQADPSIKLPEVYRDEEYPFSFRFPSDWEGVIRPDENPNMLVVIAGSEVNGSQPIFNIMTLAFDNAFLNEVKNHPRQAKAGFQQGLKKGRKDSHLKDLKIVSVGGKEGVLAHYVVTENNGTKSESFQFFFSLRNKTFIVTAGCVLQSPNDFNKNQKLFEAILYSLRFEHQAESSTEEF